MASQVEGARADPLFLDFIQPLEKHAGGAVEAARQLKVLLAAAIAVADGSGDGNPAAAAAAEAAGTGDGALLGVEDLLLFAGGRHDNDHADYRAISIMVTSEEVGAT